MLIKGFLKSAANGSSWLCFEDGILLASHKLFIAASHQLTVAEEANIRTLIPNDGITGEHLAKERAPSFCCFAEGRIEL